MSAFFRASINCRAEGVGCPLRTHRGPYAGRYSLSRIVRYSEKFGQRNSPNLPAETILRISALLGAACDQQCTPTARNNVATTACLTAAKRTETPMSCCWKCPYTPKWGIRELKQGECVRKGILPSRKVSAECGFAAHAFLLYRNIRCHQDVLVSMSANACRFGATIAGVGARGNSTFPGLVMNAAIQPAFMAPKTSHA